MSIGQKIATFKARYAMIDSEKVFDRIANEYEFFMDHSTESRCDLEIYQQTFQNHSFPDRSLRVLDYGCGAGRFTAKWIDRLPSKTTAVEISLLEPARQQLNEAAQRLASRSVTPVVTFGDLNNLSGCYDLIVANHCFYYVPDVTHSLWRLVAALDQHGILIIAISGQDNLLIQLWQQGFFCIDEAVPYHTAETVENACRALGLDAVPRDLTYQISFADSRAHRETMLRFLFDKHLARMPLEPLVAFFDRFSHQGQINIETTSRQWSITPPKR